MFSHEALWNALDRLAETSGLSPSGLAKKAGLDPTSFNRSKRVSKDGRARWPSTESISKVLDVTGTSFNEFQRLLERDLALRGNFPSPTPMPVLGLAKAGGGGFFDDGGYPAGTGWDEIELPSMSKNGDYALRITGDSMMPLYRDGDVILVSPNSAAHVGDRVVVKTLDGEVMAKVLTRKSGDEVELYSFNQDHPTRTLKQNEIEWMARITWASQ